MEFSIIEATILFIIGSLCLFWNEKVSKYIVSKQRPYLEKFFGSFLSFDSILVVRFYRFWTYSFGAMAYIGVIAVLFGPINL